MLALLSLSCLSLLVNALAPTPPQQLYSPLIYRKVLDTFCALPVPTQYPQYTNQSAGDWLYFTPDTWTSGFFPATAYALNARKTYCRSADLQDTDWLSLGRAASNALIPLEVNNSVGHDVGFLSFPFADELVVNPLNKTAQDVVNAFAHDLAARFNPIVGCTRSWDSPDPIFEQVIIDNMMNLEVLFQSAALTGNNTLRDIAITHADTTMINHIRPDGSTWHVVEYNTFTGAVIRKRTAQGYSDNSTWSRGQAWAIYGFANMYRNTHDTIYLETARRVAQYFLDNIPADGIVPWDFNAPLIPAPRPADSSAATIAVNGLLMMAQLDAIESEFWIDAAIQILNNMTSLAWRPSWQSILANGTVNMPANNSMTGIVYGDYYFIRAGNELLSMGLTKC
ncbi:hypothetical protein AX15_004929 [Amanita polypyramis BW_CC]|nr:hypothetical protein AX15_004929 [Amanita polypyramis BW_CC]